MDNLISKRSATERLIIAKTLLESILQDMPTADFNDYTERLWKEAYERGKEDAQPRKGKWIKGIGENGVNTSLYCDQCGYENAHWYEWNFCPNCGARMEE